MQIIRTSIPDVLLFEPEVFGDERGWFCESFRQDIFEQHAGCHRFVQDNESFSRYGVVRGLHYQKPPHVQGKLVRVIRGEVLDVAVDIRKGSPTFGHHTAQLLNESNRRMMWIPPGFAHGFAVLSQTAVFSYKCTDYYAPSHDAGIRWNDPAIGIEWSVPESEIRLSDKDLHHPMLHEIEGIVLDA
ncbi:MAG TPA: dTDP-4-dehydrorhamnose 3,5-epimerase [Chlorobaculum sp.]|jgi:dTDP-4-dehydrorhamnose 3,5-epimerase|uniref:dTDP-4-dehydrorhamnose 3,5-epimerase n=1 Tax=Chlorobaculum tepidum (strain ATCC 49652 / DSM 12025 / NBRC 103806 / TLS) TaxID=194439 RepID=Q8KFM0_CHLTE|nr:dTDP-4-dehydrorhamnose 3,5-epimerase [Chlorobaculum tepidum]AAM71552.1 dTDP-4-dehydrorhamnose 3,5-epimerase [Chlorobaculum tepidum TLS]HBU23779.1 dTDP-4-dehydrorhamnose 3,5-epimerase [Chlorobaculum sp.]